MNSYLIIGTLIIALIITIRIISILNSFKRLSIKVEEANSGIDVALTKRYDVLTKMIEVVKGYMKHEKEVLFTITEIRQGMSLKEKVEANNEMDDTHKKISVLVEQYPELKANENFKVLQKSIIEVEEHLQAARRMYNSNVSIYNQTISVFPKNILANLEGLQPKKFFEASQEERQNVKTEI